MRFYFRKATLSSCVPLVLKLHDNVWGWSCVLKICGIVHGRSVFAVPHLFQGELQVEESFSSPEERQEKKFLPCLLLLWVVGLLFFFSPFQFPVG